MSEYSVEECLDKLCEKISFLENENKQLKDELNLVKQKQLFNIELIKNDIIDSLNKKLKTDIMLLSNKIETICQENINLKQDQKLFNERMLNQITTLSQVPNKNPYDSDNDELSNS